MLLVYGAALRLLVWPVRAAYFRSLVPLQTGPVEILDETLLGVGEGPLLVSILYAEEELAACAFCEEVIEERRPQRSQMQVAGW